MSIYLIKFKLIINELLKIFYKLNLIYAILFIKILNELFKLYFCYIFNSYIGFC